MSAESISRRYQIQSAAGHFEAGQTVHPEQVLVGIQLPHLVVLRFSTSGELQGLAAIPIPASAGAPTLDDAAEALRHWKAEVDFRPATISIAAFLVPERCIGLGDLPEHYQEVLDHPGLFEVDRRIELLADIDQWKERGDFVLLWDEEYYLNNAGELLSS